MGENDRWIDLPHERGNTGQRRGIVKNAQILKKRRMHGGSKNPGRGASLFPTLCCDRFGPECLGSCAAVSQIPHVNVPALLLQKQQGAGVEKLDVVGMSADCQYGFFDHEVGIL